MGWVLTILFRVVQEYVIEVDLIMSAVASEMRRSQEVDGTSLWNPFPPASLNPT